MLIYYRFKLVFDSKFSNIFGELFLTSFDKVSSWV